MTDDKADRGNSVKTLLAEAIRKRDELNTFIKVLQEMHGASLTAPAQDGSQGELTEQRSNGAVGETSDPVSVVFPGMFFGKTQPQAARLLLDRVRRPLKTRVIVECLQKGGLTVGGKKPAINMWGILDRNRDTFILVPKAGWGLVDWYDASVIAKMRKDKSPADADPGEPAEKDS